MTQGKSGDGGGNASHRRWRAALALGLLLALGGCAPVSTPTPGSRLELVVPGSPLHGPNGLAFSPDGTLHVGSVMGQTLSAVDIATGATRIVVPAPQGLADDLAFLPDGTLLWTDYFTGQLRRRAPGGDVQTIARDLPGLNSLAWRKRDGRLFVSQVFAGDAVLDVAATPPRRIAEGLGGLNGFSIGDDGAIYGPLWFKGQVIRLDPDRGTTKIVAGGFGTPAAVKIGPDGQLYVADQKTGDVLRVDPATGAKALVASLRHGLDNLALDGRGHLYVSNFVENSIEEITLATGRVRSVVAGALVLPGGLALAEDPRGETLYIADVSALRSVDPRHGDGLIKLPDEDLPAPTAVHVGDRHVVVASWLGGSVQVNERSGRPLCTWRNLAAPYDAVEQPDGSVLIAEFATGRLLRARCDDPAVREVVATGLQGPVALALDGAGGVYVSEWAGGTVSRIDLARGDKSPTVTGLSRPEGIALGQGRLVVAEVGEKRVVAIDLRSGERTVLADRLPIGVAGNPAAPPPFAVTGVAVSQSGDVYVSSDLESAVYRIRRDPSWQGNRAPNGASSSRRR